MTKITSLLRAVPILAALVLMLLFASPAWAATFTVNTERDEPDADVGDGQCDVDPNTAGNQCTLRAAVQEANSNGETDTINIQPGTFRVQESNPGNPPTARIGDLEIEDDAPGLDVRIVGSGRDATTIDGRNENRIFAVQEGAEAEISDVTITNGDKAGGGPGGGPGGGNRTPSGGAILNSGQLTISNSLLTENVADAEDGGAILNTGDLTLIETAVTNNEAGDDGGGIFNNGGTVTLRRSLINGNTATGNGGGIFNNGSGAVLDAVNTTITNNTAGGLGGGISNNAGDADLLNVTLNQNSASRGSNLENTGGVISAENTIVANGQNSPNCSGNISSQGNNLDTGASCGFGQPSDIENGDPNLGPLRDNGGPTQTNALRAGSEAIDTADNTTCPDTDQRNETRPQDGDGDGTAVCDIGAFEVQPSTDLAVQKDAPGTVQAGQEFTYTLTVTNSGPNTATGVTLADQLPGGVTPSGPLPDGCTYDEQSNTITCDLGRLANGETVERNFQVTANSAGEKTNEAEIDSDVGDDNQQNNTATATTTVTSAADLRIDKQAPDQVDDGQQFDFTLTATNEGPSPAEGVTITDELPQGVSFVSASAGCTYDATNRTVTCDLGTLASGATAQRTITVQAESPGDKTNTATVSSQTDDPNNQNNSDSTLTEVAPEADLAISKTDSQDPVLAGEEFTYTLTVTNNGPSRALNTQITDQLPDGVTPSGPLPDGCTYDAASNTIACDLGQLANGETVERNFQVTSSTAGTKTNQASVSTSTTDPQSANNSVSETTEVTPAADLAIDKQAPEEAATSEPFTYTLTVTNNGPNPAEGVTLTDELPQGVTPDESTLPADCTYDAQANTVTCDIGTLASGETVERQFQVTSSERGEKTNTATVSSSTADPRDGNNTDSATTDVDPTADLVAAKSGPDTAVEGEEFSYTVTVRNDGPSRARDVTITDQLPTNVGFVSAGQDCTFNENDPNSQSDDTVVCQIGPLASGASAERQITVRATQDGPAENTATVDSTTNDDNPNNNSATITTTITAAVDLAVAKQAPQEVFVGEEFTYTLTASNQDNDDTATGVTLTDRLPRSVEPVEGSLPQDCTYDAQNRTVTCDIGTLAAGASTDRQFRVQANSAGDRDNVVRISGDQPDNDTSDNRAVATTQVNPVADLAVSKTDS